jgi:hypothetical protein
VVRRSCAPAQSASARPSEIAVTPCAQGRSERIVLLGET